MAASWPSDNTTAPGPFFWQFLSSKDYTDTLRASVLCVFVVFNISGNVMVFAVLTLRMMRKARAMSVLLLSLAVADICTAFTLIPYVTFWFYGTYRMGNVVCKLNAVVNAVVGNASILTHVLIGLERYRSLRRVDLSKSNIKAIYISIAVVWIYNVVVGIPHAFIFKVKEFPNGIKVCMFDTELMKGSFGELMDMYAYASTTINYFIPFGVMVICYVGVVYQMRQSIRRVAGRNIPIRKNKQARSVALMCILVVLVFTIRSLPYQITYILIHTKKSREIFDIFIDLWVVYFTLSCLSPVIYGVLWKAFRQHALSLFCSRCFKIKVQSETTLTHTDGMSLRNKTKTTAVGKQEAESEVFVTDESNKGGTV